MPGYGARVILFAASLALFVVGSFLSAIGIELRTCSYSIEIPTAFVGFVDLSSTEYRYWSNVVLNASGITIEPGRVEVLGFRVNSTMGYIVIRIVGNVTREGYSGRVSIVRHLSNGSRTVVLSTTLGPSKSYEGRGLNTTLQFLRELPPGNYTLELALDTPAEVRRLEIYGPSSTAMERVQPRFEVRPEDYRVIKIEYPCGVDRTRSAVGLALSAAGAAILVALYASSTAGVSARRTR